MLLLAACAGSPWQPHTPDTVLFEMTHAERRGMEDDRGRFREIFCAVLDARGTDLPGYRPCGEALRDIGAAEAGATGEPVWLGQSAGDLLFLLVPGLGWDCFEAWLGGDQAGLGHSRRLGFDVRLVPVGGLSGTEHNARQLHDFIAALPAGLQDRRLVLVGYSKGTPDILTALTLYPGLQQRVSAVVSLAGAVAGSPLAAGVTQEQANLLTMVPGARCDKGDEGAVESMRAAVRKNWLQDNPLPASVRYYSLVTYPDHEHISRILQTTHRKLGELDVRNDGQLIIYDQMIPGSRLLGFLNADHWAVAVAIEREHAFIGSTLVNRNDYPREALMEALFRYVEEDLGRPGQVRRGGQPRRLAARSP
jgi:hypothetical protein